MNLVVNNVNTDSVTDHDIDRIDNQQRKVIHVFSVWHK